MTNEAIIEAAMELNGIEEEAHTYNRWKSMGYQVRKGEHAAFKATIWKHGRKKVEVDDIDSGHLALLEDITGGELVEFVGYEGREAVFTWER